LERKGEQGYKREIGASILSLCCLYFDVWLLAREPMHLGVLRVLTEQTLEINSVVKDSTFLDPSLAKEVKDSSLTILHQFRVTSAISLARGAHQ
jgi:hypothetical protein